ncbi:hypothetical protein [Microcoleus sp. Pol7_B1]
MKRNLVGLGIGYEAEKAHYLVENLAECVSPNIVERSFYKA